MIKNALLNSDNKYDRKIKQKFIIIHVEHIGIRKIKISSYYPSLLFLHVKLSWLPLNLIWIKNYFLAKF